MRAHIVRSRGQVAVHGRTPAVAAHMPPAVLLVIDLRIGTAAGCCCSSSSSLLLPHSVKPAAQRGVQKSRGFVPPEAERSRALNNGALHSTPSSDTYWPRTRGDT